mgnify:CR=1 FL=1
MVELDFPGYMRETDLYDCVRDVLNGRGYTEQDGEELYNCDAVTVTLEEDVLEISGPSTGEEEAISSLIDLRLEFS